MTVYGDPAVLNAVGDDRMSDGMRLRQSLGSGGEVASMPAGATGRAGDGTGIEAVWGETMEALTRAMDHLACTLENDGYHLQRASLEIDEAMNSRGRRGGGRMSPIAV